MSTFLGFSSALVPLGSTPTYLQSVFSSLVSSYTWQIVRQAIVPISIVGTATNPSYAFDLSTATITTGTVPIYLGCQTAGFIPTAMYVKASSTATTTAPLTFTLDHSSDGSAWTTQQTFTSQTGWTTSETRKYTISGASSHLYWRINVTAVQSSTALNIVDWVLEDANGNWLTSANFFDVIPPASETIGNATCREVIRWKFPAAGTSIVVVSAMELLTNLPQMQSVDTATAGAVTVSVTIGGSTVSYVGNAGSTAAQNLRGLYEALAASANANFTPWYWIWFPATATQTGTGILAIQKTPAMNVATFTSSNCTVRSRGSSVINTPLPQLIQSSRPDLALTIDLINGFIYFLQVCARGIALAIKTNTNYYTPIHMCYGSNTEALAQLPVADLAPYGLPCFPIELFVGTSDVVANSGGTGYISHWWGIAGNYSFFPLGVNYFNVDYTADASLSAFSHHIAPSFLQDFALNPNYLSGLNATGALMTGEGLVSGADPAGGMYSIHRLSSSPGTVSVTFNVAQGWYGRFTAPYLSGLDWYKFTGTAPANEQLLVGPSNDFTTTISSGGTSIDSSISVASTTGFPASGWLVIDGEVIQYTGVSGGNTFTGCTRGMYNSSSVTLFTGTKVYIGAWWVFIVAGLVFCGYQIPS